MKRTVILGLFLLTFVFFGTTHSAAADIASGQKAVIIQPNSSNDFSTSSFDQSVSNAITDGANYIYLVIPVHQANTGSTTLYASYDTPTDQSLEAATSYIHSKGAQVAFSIHDDSDDGQWRAFINPGDRADWFASYGSELNHYATIAQETGANEMVLGTEMTDMTVPSSNGSNTSYWESMIAKVRTIYSGKLTYSAQHDGYMGEVSEIGFWSKLDYIGISAYYTMGYDTSVNGQMSEWATADSSDIAPVAAEYGKQVVFTEVGYQSKQGETVDPGSSYSESGGVDLTAQANSYQALLQYWNAKSYFAGVAFWGWSVNPSAGGTNDTDYTPQGKPAEQIMKQWFTGGSTTTTTPPVTATAYNAVQTSGTTLTTNNSTSLSYTVTANASTSNAIVDVEIYNASGQQVYQSYEASQTVTPSGLGYTFNWTPATAGTYTAKVGIFTANWARNLYWNGSVASLTVSNPVTTPTPPITTPPVVTPPTPPITTPPVTTTPPTNETVTVWWPSSGSAVTGVQPFKALVQGLNNNQYTMYWQVDGGTLNAMTGETDAGQYMESLVNLAPWNWQPTNQYNITFVAKDLNGNVIATQSVPITVTH